MSKGCYRFAVSLILAVVLTLNVAAEDIDDSPEAVSLYAKGKRLLRENNWFDAANVFGELEARFPGSPNLDLFVFNRAKARLYLGEYSEAAAGFNYFVTRFTNSTFLPYAHYFLGDALYLGGDVNRSIRSYLTAYEMSRSKELDDLLLASLTGAFRSANSVNLSEADFADLPKNKACALIRPLADIHIQRGEMERAGELMSICGEQLDITQDPGMSQVSDRRLEIALVLPMSGEMQNFGQEIYNGAVIAAELYREETGRRLKLTPYDTKGDPVEAARIVGELSRATTTDVVIGPLTSDESMVASAVLNCSSLPLIAPAATEAGLTRLSSVSFQLAPNIDLEGVTLATFAMRNLGADSVAIISSTADDHLRMTRAFADHFRKMGGTVVATEYYRSRDTDFGAYIRDIKAILIGQHDDSTFFINANADTLDLDIIPAGVDCLFLPGDPRQLRQLLPQINFYNLSGQYLGSDGWGDDAVYKLGDNITKGAVFSSPFLEGRQSDQYLKLAVAYDSRYGSRPTRLSALGYDAVTLVTMAAGAGATNRDEILSRLATVSEYEGASGRVTFGEHRENTEMPLYRIESERAVLLSGRQEGSDDTTSGP